MGYFRELPNIAYQSPLTHKNSSRDFIVIKNIFRRTKLYDFLEENVSLLDIFIESDVKDPDEVKDKIRERIDSIADFPADICTFNEVFTKHLVVDAQHHPTKGPVDFPAHFDVAARHRCPVLMTAPISSSEDLVTHVAQFSFLGVNLRNAGGVTTTGCTDGEERAPGFTSLWLEGRQHNILDHFIMLQELQQSFIELST